MAKPVEVSASESGVWEEAQGGGAEDPAASRAMARVGTTLHGKWRLDALLGIGGTAVVYAATHRNGSRAAVKILNPELSSHSQVRERFFREGYAANAVGHEGAVKVLDDDEAQDGSLFLVTELLEGEALEQRRVRMGGRLSEAEVLRLSEQLLDVIAAAHARGIVHRDLKPDNVFLTTAGQLKVLDFGIAALRELSTARAGTLTGSVMGTPAYMPPEQALGLWDDVDALSDIWAWGATMFHLLSGEVVHDGRTLNEQLGKAMTGSAAPLSWVAPDVTSAVAAVVDRALEREREKRWPDARSMQAAVRAASLERLATAGTSVGAVATPTLPGLATPPPPSPEGERQSMPTFRATALPVEFAPSIAPPATVARRRQAAFAIGGALALAAAGTCARSLVGDRSLGSTAATSSIAAPPSSPPLAPAVLASPEASPTAAETDASSALPSPAKNVAPAPTSVRPTPRPPSSKGAGTQACSPPYVVDVDTGKHRWKLECL
jgi:serine/threonine protein kinase